MPLRFRPRTSSLSGLPSLTRSRSISALVKGGSDPPATFDLSVSILMLPALSVKCLPRTNRRRSGPQGRIIPSRSITFGRGNGLHPLQRWVHQRRIGRAIPDRPASSRPRRRGPVSVAGPRPQTDPVTSAVAGTCAGDHALPGR